jgi:hypothetical protein
MLVSISSVDLDKPFPLYLHEMWMMFLGFYGMLISIVAVRKILKIQLGTKALDKKDMEDLRHILTDLETKLNDRIKRIPARGIPELGFTPGKDDEKAKAFDVYTADPEMARSLNPDELKHFIGVTPTDGMDDQVVKYHFASLAAFHNWGRILLSLLIDKVYLPFDPTGMHRFIDACE